MREWNCTIVGLAILTAALGSGAVRVPEDQPPIVDHHQHLYGPGIAALSTRTPPLDAARLIAYLDAAGIRRAVVLSTAYQLGNPNRPAVENEYERVRAENDWTSREVARFPDRLRGFCGVNPLKDYALDEIARCANDPVLKAGLKLHFGNSDVNLENPEHVTRLRRVFALSNDHRMAIVAHIRSTVSRNRPWGPKQARIFLDEVLPAAPDVAVQIAHLAGAGGYDDPAIDRALSVFVDAVAKHDPRLLHVYFDVSGVAGVGKWREKADLIATRIRQLGAERVLYGSDAATPTIGPREAWKAFCELPLSSDERRVIATNVAPYMK
jgi:predicted TIM-barrel fold metal-dependent hydrolase